MSVIETEPELSGPQLARALGVANDTVRRWKAQGAPCETYNSKLIRYRLSEVRAWLTPANRPGGKDAGSPRG